MTTSFANISKFKVVLIWARKSLYVTNRNGNAAPFDEEFPGTMLAYEEAKNFARRKIVKYDKDPAYAIGIIELPDDPFLATTVFYVGADIFNGERDLKSEPLVGPECNTSEMITRSYRENFKSFFKIQVEHWLARQTWLFEDE